MENKEKQIEEITKELDYCETKDCQTSCAKCRAEWIIEQGYQRVGKDSVVLTNERYNRLCKRITITQARIQTQLAVEKRTKDIFKKLFAINGNTRAGVMYFELVELAKEFGVEIKEQK